MTTLRRTLLAASLTAAGLLGTASIAQAAEEADVSTIYGRASPPNTQIITRSNFKAASDADANEYPTIVARATTNPSTATPPASTSTATGAEYAKSDTITTPTGHYLDVDRSGTTIPDQSETALIHEEELDGVPLMEGRGVREGVDFHAVVVQPEPAFDVADVLGRSSPPAPESAGLYFGLGS